MLQRDLATCLFCVPASLVFDLGIDSMIVKSVVTSIVFSGGRSGRELRGPSFIGPEFARCDV